MPKRQTITTDQGFGTISRQNHLNGKANERCYYFYVLVNNFEQKNDSSKPWFIVEYITVGWSQSTKLEGL